MGKMLRWLSVFLTAFFILTAIPGFAQAANQDIQVIVDGKQVTFDVQPQLIENRTFVPLRAVLEAMGATVWWDQSTQTGYAEKDGVKVRMPLNSDKIFRGDQEIVMDVPVQMIQNRLLIPLRFTSQALGGVVDWQAATSTNPMTVTIKSSLTAASIEVINGDGIVSTQQIQQVQSLIKDAKISQKVSAEYGLYFKNPIKIYLTADKAGYRQVLLNQHFDAQEVEAAVQSSAGLAVDNSIYFPLSAHQETASLKNVLAHELVHILFNQNGMDNDKMPSWVNEGLAWRVGLETELEGAPTVVVQGREAELRNYILQVRKDGKLIGFLNHGLDTVNSLATYNVELQDWLAVDYLLTQFGTDKLRDYFQYVQQSPYDAFVRTFGISQDTFEKQFNGYLDQLISRPDKGVKITFRVTDKFNGVIGVLPKGENNWRIYQLEPGDYTARIMPDGSVEGISGGRLSGSTGGIETDVMYIGLSPNSEVKDGGKAISFAGFALKYGFGEYYLLNGWETYTDSTTSYLSNDQIIGVQILSIENL